MQIASQTLEPMVVIDKVILSNKTTMLIQRLRRQGLRRQGLRRQGLRRRLGFSPASEFEIEGNGGEDVKTDEVTGQTVVNGEFVDRNVECGVLYLVAVLGEGQQSSLATSIPCVEDVDITWVPQNIPTILVEPTTIKSDFHEQIIDQQKSSSHTENDMASLGITTKDNNIIATEETTI